MLDTPPVKTRTNIVLSLCACVCVLSRRTFCHVDNSQHPLRVSGQSKPEPQRVCKTTARKKSRKGSFLVHVWGPGMHFLTIACKRFIWLLPKNQGALYQLKQTVGLVKRGHPGNGLRQFVENYWTLRKTGGTAPACQSCCRTWRAWESWDLTQNSFAVSYLRAVLWALVMRPFVSGGVCAMGPYLVCGIYWVWNGVQNKGPC